MDGRLSERVERANKLTDQGEKEGILVWSGLFPHRAVFTLKVPFGKFYFLKL